MNITNQYYVFFVSFVLYLNFLHHLVCTDLITEVSDTFSWSCNATQIHDYGYKVTCIGLRSVPSPKQIPVDCRNVTELILRNNLITKVKDNEFIPFVNLHLLDMSNTKLEKCQNGSFLGLTGLRSLILSHITPAAYLAFESDTFRPMTSLKVIDISSSVVHRPSVFHSLCSIVSDLDHLNLNNLSVIQRTMLLDITQELSRCFSKIKIKKLSLDWCQIRSVSFQSLLNIRHLEYVSAANNEMIMEKSTLILYWLTMINVTYLDGSCQDIHGCDDPYPWSDWLPNQPVMFPHINATLLEEEWQFPSDSNVLTVYALPYLQTFRLQHVFNAIVMGFHSLPSFCWKNNHLVNFDLAYLPGLHFDGSIYCMHHLRFVNFRAIKSLIFNMEFFSDMPKLEVLLLGSSRIKNLSIFFESHLTTIFDNNINLKFLDLSDLGLHTLHKNVLRHQKHLKTLILRNNKLSSIENGTFDSTSLDHLDLAYNNFQEIPINIIKEMGHRTKAISNVTTLNLNYNPFFCDCNSITNINIMLHSRVIIQDLNHSEGRLQCLLTDRKRHSFPEALIILQDQCRKCNNMYVECLKIVYPLALYITLTVSCFYRYRWKTKYLLYRIMETMGIKKPDQFREDFAFDAFIAYSGKDEIWVGTNLIVNLEEIKKPYNLCIPDRNFLPGQVIAETIVLAIEKSKKTIILVTKSFLRSKWCIYESRVAIAHHLKRQTGLIVILFPGVQKLIANNLTIRNLLDNATCLEWTENKETHPVFWLELCQELGAPIPAKQEQELQDIFFFSAENLHHV